MQQLLEFAYKDLPVPERIAFLLDYSPNWWCSADSTYLRLCQALKRRNVECVVVYADKSRSQDAPRVFRENGVELLAANYSEGAFSYYRQLKRIISQYQITTVHTGFFNYFSAVPWLARLGGVKQILFTEYTSGLWDPKSWWKTALAGLRARTAGGPVTRFIAVSDFIKQRLIEIGIPVERIVRVYLGVDSEHFRPSPEGRDALAEQYPIQREEVIMAAVTSFLPWKRVPVMVEACGLLARRGIAVRLFLCGEGPQRGELEQIARRFGITEWVHFLGHRPNVEKILQGSDIFVHSSVGEAFGWAIIEAMACGLPVVGSRSGAITELVVDDATGFLATPLDPTSFADAVQKLVLDPNLRRKMGAAARRRVEENFTLDTYAANMICVYESIWSL